MKPGAILAGVCVVWLVGCGAHGQYRHADGGMAERRTLERGKQDMARLIEQSIQDPAKVRRVTELSEQIVHEAMVSSERSRALHRQLYTLNARYDATHEEFARILDDLHNGRMSTAARILALRFRMKDAVTAEEWKALTQAMNEYRARYRHGKGASAGTTHGYEP